MLLLYVYYCDNMTYYWRHFGPSLILLYWDNFVESHKASWADARAILLGIAHDHTFGMHFDMLSL